MLSFQEVKRNIIQSEYYYIYIFLNLITAEQLPGIPKVTEKVIIRSFKK